MNSKHATLALACCIAITALNAEEAEETKQLAEQPEPDIQEQTGEITEELVVYADPLSHSAFPSDVSIIKDDILERLGTESLGAVIESVPGARNASFGQAVGRPVIHGMDGPRIRVLYDRTRTMDVSVSSADHPPSVEPFIAQQIEVLKGPNTLLFGSGSSGGVINTETGRIPKSQALEPFNYRVETRYTGNSAKTALAGRVDMNLGSNLVLHLDSFQKVADPYDIPGCAESSYLEAREAEEHEEEEEHHEEEEEEEEDHEEEEEVCGTLEGSQLDLGGTAIGASYVHERGFVGVAFSSVDSQFGIPIAHAHAHGEEEEHHEEEEEEEEEDHEEEEEEGHHEEEEDTSIDLSHQRVDFEAGIIDPFGVFEDLNIRLGLSNYEHDEILGDEPVTTFKRDSARDLRIVLRSKELGGWRHAIGFQHGGSEFSLITEGHGVGPADSSYTSLFWVSHVQRGGYDYQLGTRIEQIQYEESTLGTKDFRVYGLSGGVAKFLGDDLRLNGELNLSSRAPTVEELLVEGEHFATASEIESNPDLDNESMMAVGLGLLYIGDMGEFTVNAYHRSVDGFIYEAPTGEIHDELPVYSYFQRDTRFTGMDLMLESPLHSDGRWSVNGRIGYDFVLARIDHATNENLPRKPAGRLTLGLDVTGDLFAMSATYARHGEVSASDTAELELPTDAYGDLTVDLEYKLETQMQANMIFFIRGRNLLDEEQRPHTPIVKDMVPLPGRSLELGVRIRN